jgi:hypothetical protein
VEAKFEELDYPMDVIWLDIEHTNGDAAFCYILVLLFLALN